MFITFEGGEGAGKSTQARLLAEALRAGGRTVCLTREPGGCPSAEAVRAVLLDGGHDFTPTAEVLLIAAARAEHVSHVIRPALARGDVVICDRFSDSTRVYQGLAGGLAAEAIAAVDRLATGGLVPDLTLLMDLPPETGLERISNGQRVVNAFDARPVTFHTAVRNGFLALAAAEPNRIRVMDATAGVDDVAARVWQVVGGMLAGVSS